MSQVMMQTRGVVESFSVEFEGRTLQGDIFLGRTWANALYLHGAGRSSRKGCGVPRAALQACGAGTIAFDSIGHGETGGKQSESSLQRRGQQVDAVLRARNMVEPLAVIGTSMGAYDAVKLVERSQVRGLVLVVPAVYTPEAYSVPFGSQFSEIIRQPRSWENTDAWSILGRFTGRLLVIAAENDAVIPHEIPERLVKAAIRASQRELLVIPGTDHGYLFSAMEKTPPLLDSTIQQMLRTVSVR